MKREPRRSIVFDTGPLLEMASGSVLGAYATRLLQSGEAKAFTIELNLGELKYLICRKSGEERSKEVVKNIVESGYFTIFTSGEFIDQAANMKCARSLAFSDCFALSIGESMSIPVLFATHESELMQEMKKRAFKTEILFLEDLAKRVKKNPSKNSL